jgi:toxin FitB
MIILDTNVVSEPSQLRPAKAVLDWLAAQDPAELFTTAATEAEIHYGLSLLDPGKKRNALAHAAGQFFENQLSNRVLPFDRAAAQEFGKIAALRKKAGLQIKVFDAQIAAIARVHGASVATRDLSDFKHTGVKIINPWTA